MKTGTAPIYVVRSYSLLPYVIGKKPRSAHWADCEVPGFPLLSAVS